jgi:dephospho-CoA kinase
MIAMKTILGIVGMPGAGKSLAISIGAGYAPVVVMGDIIREEAQILGLEINSANLGKVARDIRLRQGLDAVARRCIPKIRDAKGDYVIVDGIRAPQEVTAFKTEFAVIIIAVLVPDEIRFQRLRARNRADDSLKMADILARDQREIQFGLKTLIEHADYTLDNSQSQADLQEQCQNLFSQIISQGQRP